MSRSPLSVLEGYQKIFLDIWPVDYLLIHGQGPSGVMGNMDKPYTARRTVVDDTLYLTSLFFFDESPSEDTIRGVPAGDFYRTMEKFVGARFQRNEQTGNTYAPVSVYGVIPARWFSGSFDIREKRTVKNSPGLTDWWEKFPVTRLTFRDGKLVDTEQVCPDSERASSSVDERSRKTLAILFSKTTFQQIVQRADISCPLYDTPLPNISRPELYRGTAKTIRPLEKVTSKVGALSNARVTSARTPMLDESDSESSGIVSVSTFFFSKKVPLTQTAGMTPCGLGSQAVRTRVF